MNRRASKEVKIKNIAIGAENPIAVQSMCNADMGDYNSVSAQIEQLIAANCDIVRVAVPDKTAVKTLGRLCENYDIPIVADIHFDYKLAIESVYAGVSKVRINPGNIGSEENVKKVAEICASHNVPIRVGVNSGSIEKHILAKYGVTPLALAESAFYHVALLEKFDFNNIVISAKSSNVYATVQANRIIAERCDYPLHIGVTEAGTYKSGIMKSSAGIGSLLLDGIGDTIRVSLTADPVLEVQAGHGLLRAIGIDKSGINIISCPTCTRCKAPLIELAGEIEKAVSNIDKNITVAIMGCGVNGPGEASHADVGVAFSSNEGLIFEKGKIIKKVPFDNVINELLELIVKY